mmetsp:Transcript_15273/g.23245  ORF Transcript_15273/g.23245 Transcript_15273/m.23245 type:complete len:80 (+) Transcript_15273:424-663(+)
MSSSVTRHLVEVPTQNDLHFWFEDEDNNIKNITIPSDARFVLLERCFFLQIVCPGQAGDPLSDGPKFIVAKKVILWISK